MSVSGATAATATSAALASALRRRGAVQRRGQVEDEGDLRHREITGTGVHDRPGGVELDHRGHPAQRVVAAPPGHLADRGATPRGQRRHEHLRDQLSGLPCGDERSQDEVAGIEGSPAGGGYTGHRPAEQAEHHRHLGGRVRVCDRTDRRPPVADRRVGDQPQYLAQQGLGDRGRRVALHVAVPGERADPDAGVVGAHVVELVNHVDVDQQLRVRQPHGQQRHQALPAREHRGGRCVVGQHGEGFGQTGRPGVCEGSGLHATVTIGRRYPRWLGFRKPVRP